MKRPVPIIINDESYKAAGKLEGLVAIITGGDSGIGAATAIAFAKEGAKVVINYFEEDKDAQTVAKIIQNFGGSVLLSAGDLRDKATSQRLVDEALEAFGALDIIVNNAGTQTTQKHLEDISEDQLEQTFRTNILSFFFLAQAALPHLHGGASIINTTSVTAYRGSEELLDYSATKGAITSFTRSLSQNLAHRDIRVNAVAPGPVWTPLVLDSFDEKKLKEFGKEQPLGRAAQPIEVAPAYVFLASKDACYITGQVIHVNGGEVING